MCGSANHTFHFLADLLFILVWEKLSEYFFKNVYVFTCLCWVLVGACGNLSLGHTDSLVTELGLGS